MNKNLITSGRTRRKKPTVSTIFNGLVYYGDPESEYVESQIDSPFAIASDMNADGTVIAVGQAFHSSATQVGVGVVRVYYWNSLAWVQKGGDIIPSDASSSVGGKVQISADGNTVLFSYANSTAPFGKMVVAAYGYDGTQWNNKQLPILEESSTRDIALSGDGLTAVYNTPGPIFTVYDISAKTYVTLDTTEVNGGSLPGITSSNINYNGTVITVCMSTLTKEFVQIFKKINGVWEKSLVKTYTDGNKWYSAISNDGNTITIGDFGDISVYDISSGNFTLKSAQTLQSYYGGICDFNEDATMIIVSNSQQGICDVYKWNVTNTTWEKYGNSITTLDTLGSTQTTRSVSINNAGNRVLISGNNYYQYDGGVDSNNFSPQAYQYNTTTKNWDKLGSPILADTMIGKPWCSADINADGSIVAYGLSNLVCSIKNTANIDTSNPQYSKVCIYTKATNTKTYINPPNSPNDRSGFGWKIALNAAGDTFVTSTLNDTGVFVYKKTAGVWAKLGNTIASVAGSNNSVSINAAGDRVAVCRVNTVDVYTYTVGSNSWALLGNSISAAGVKDVSLNANIGITDGNYIAIAYSSRIAVYEYTSGVWSLLGAQTSVFASRSAGWAYSISLNAAGNRVAVGCSDASATVFSLDGGAWTQISKDEFSFGSSVSLNDAGDRLLVGYPTLGSEGVAALYWWNGREWIAVSNRRDAYYEYGQFSIDNAIPFMTGINDSGSVCKLNADGKKFLVGSQRRGLDYAVSTR